MNSYLMQLGEFYELISPNLFAFFTQSTYGFTLLVLLVHSFIIKANYTSLISAWMANIIGVFFHELAHAVIGALCGAKPNRFIIVPQKSLINNKVYYVLGHVTFKNLRWFNAFPTALAPLLLLGIAYFIDKSFWGIFAPTLGHLIIFVYIMIVLILNAIPSTVDFKQVFTHPIGIVLWIGIITLVSLKYAWLLHQFKELR